MCKIPCFLFDFSTFAALLDVIKSILAEFIYFAANRDNAVNHILITSIVLNSILTAFDFVNVPNSDIAIF